MNRCFSSKIAINTSMQFSRQMLLTICITAFTAMCWAQTSPQFMKMFAPSPKTRVVTLKYVNAYDSSPGVAMLELPKHLDHPVPLIVTSNPAGWSQDANRCLWTGIADKFNVMILYPRGQTVSMPNATLGAPKQIVNLQSALVAVESAYPVDRAHLYAAGLSPGATEALLFAGNHPGEFAGVLAINPIVDFIAFYNDLIATGAKNIDKSSASDTVPQALAHLIAAQFGGTPDTARAAYYRRSPIIYSGQLAHLPVILYWATDDEIIPSGKAHQGGCFLHSSEAFIHRRFRKWSTLEVTDGPFSRFRLHRPL